METDSEQIAVSIKIQEVVVFDAKTLSGIQRDVWIDIYITLNNENAIHFYKKCGFEETGNEIAEEQMVRLQSGIVLPEIEMVLSAVS